MVKYRAALKHLQANIMPLHELTLTSLNLKLLLYKVYRALFKAVQLTTMRWKKVIWQ